VAPLQGRLLASHANIRHGHKSLKETNALAYFAVIEKEKSFMTLTPAVDEIKRNSFSILASVFVPGK